MGDALWSANSGVEFSDDEDRRLIGAIWPNSTSSTASGIGGVINGLTVSPGTGRTVSISAGRCVVPDGAGGGYLCSFDSATTDQAIAANVGASRTDGIFITVDDPGTGAAVVTIVTNNTPVPTDPYIRIATVTVATGASSFVAGNINNTIRTSAVDSRYLNQTQILYGTLSALPATLAVGAIYMAHD